nr:RNA ligase family protein [Sphingomonas xinjiangensis]
MLPTLVDAPPEGDGWIHEVKYDGYRTQLVIDGGEVRAYTRNGHDRTKDYRLIVEAASGLSCRRAIIDGEIVLQDQHGRCDFTGLRSAITRAPESLVFMAFDLLHHEGRNVRPLAIEQRRERLEDLVGGFDAGASIHFSQDVRGGGEAFFQAVGQMGLEGIVSKKRGSRYHSGRTRNCLKTKAWAQDEFVVVGTEATPGEPVSALLARETNDGLEYAGGAAVTLAADLRGLFYSVVDQLERAKPLPNMPKAKKARWIEPKMRVSVRYLKGSDKLRHFAGRCGRTRGHPTAELVADTWPERRVVQQVPEITARKQDQERTTSWTYKRTKHRLRSGRQRFSIMCDRAFPISPTGKWPC